MASNNTSLIACQQGATGRWRLWCKKAAQKAHYFTLVVVTPAYICTSSSWSSVLLARAHRMPWTGDDSDARSQRKRLVFSLVQLLFQHTSAPIHHGAHSFWCVHTGCHGREMTLMQEASTKGSFFIGAVVIPAYFCTHSSCSSFLLARAHRMPWTGDDSDARSQRKRLVFHWCSCYSSIHLHPFIM